MLKDYRLPPRSGKAARAVIFLHGVGDRGDGGLLGIGELWAAGMPDCAFLCPDAPFPFDMAPPDFGGRQWFSLQERTPEAMLAGTKAATPLLDDYIDGVLKQLDLTPTQLALVGFSQGTMMALYCGLRRKDPVACIVGYSGMLIGGENLKTEMRSKPPVMLAHGTADEVVPFGAMGLAVDELADAGINTKTLVCPGIGHTINDVGIAEGFSFIKAMWRD